MPWSNMKLQKSSMDSLTLAAFITFSQQGCLFPLCLHRAVKSCLYGKLRSRKTDKPVSKETTNAWIKNLLSKELGFLWGRRHSFKFGLHMRAGWEWISLVHFPFSLCMFLSQACCLIVLFGCPGGHPHIHVYWQIFSLINNFCRRNSC